MIWGPVRIGDPAMLRACLPHSELTRFIKNFDVFSSWAWRLKLLNVCKIGVGLVFEVPGLLPELLHELLAGYAVYSLVQGYDDELVERGAIRILGVVGAVLAADFVGRGAHGLLHLGRLGNHRILLAGYLEFYILCHTNFPTA